MEANWINDFLRMTLLTRTRPLDAVGWSEALIDVLRDNKPDHDIHIFGVNRTPGLPNFFLASSSESRLRGRALPITVTKKTADLFLDPDSGGLRVLQEELPMTVIYYADPSDESRDPDSPAEQKKHQIPFYDAVCIDSETHSLVIGLIVTEVSVQEFLPVEELTELMPLVRAHAFPLIEALTLRHRYAKMEEDMKSLMAMVRETNPEAVASLSGQKGEEFVESGTEDREWHPAFLQHVGQELGHPLTRVLGMSEQLKELSNTSMGTPQLAEIAAEIEGHALRQSELLKLFNHIATLSLGEVQPRKGVFPLQMLIRDIYPIAVEIAGRHRVEIKLQEYTRNVFLSGDQKTILGMIQRLMAFTIPRAAMGKFFIRTTDDPDAVEQGFAALEFEDTEKLPAEVSLAKFLDPEYIRSSNHPRLRQGGGMLYLLLSLYFEKCGGKVTITRGENGGFTVRIALPQVSRAEHEKIMAGEIS